MASHQWRQLSCWMDLWSRNTSPRVWHWENCCCYRRQWMSCSPQPAVMKLPHPMWCTRKPCWSNRLSQPRIPEYLQLALRLPQPPSKMAATTLLPAMTWMKPWRKGLDATSLLKLLGQPVAAPEDSAKGKIHTFDPFELDQPRLPSKLYEVRDYVTLLPEPTGKTSVMLGEVESPVLNPRWTASPPSSTWRPASESYGRWPRMGSRQEHFSNMLATS